MVPVPYIKYFSELISSRSPIQPDSNRATKHGPILDPETLSPKFHFYSAYRYSDPPMELRRLKAL
jgi:hypothetical protein